MAKAGCQPSVKPRITVGRVGALLKWIRQNEGAQVGREISQIVRWNWRLSIWYIYLQAGIRDLGYWRRVLERGKHLCRQCQTKKETGQYLLTGYEEIHALHKWD